MLLADFFRLFGRSLNIEEVGISCSHGGSFYNKLDAEKEQPQKLWMLSVEDPADATNDLTKGSWNINMVSAQCMSPLIYSASADAAAERTAELAPPAALFAVCP